MIKLKDFSAFYGKKKIINNVSINIENSELTCLLGANGSGKSTLFKGICGRIKTEGECLIDGSKNSIPPKKLSRLISYVPQKAGLSISLSILDAVLMGAYGETDLFSEYSKEQKEKALKILKSFLDVDPETDFLTLSEGQKQLVILSRTIMQGAGNLLFDEPDSALDFKNKHIVFKEIKKLSENNCVLISLHDPNFALNYCDRLLFIEKGEIFADIHTENVAENTLESCFKRLYGEVKLIKNEGKFYLLGK